MRDTNEMELVFDSISVNEGFARVAVARPHSFRDNNKESP